MNDGMPTAIGKFYRAWLKSPKLFGHSSDEAKFYHFVRACHLYGKIPRNSDWLRQQLESDGVATHWIEKAVTLFDACYDYETARSSFPAFMPSHTPDA